MKTVFAFVLLLISLVAFAQGPTDNATWLASLNPISGGAEFTFYPTNAASQPVMWYDASAITGKSVGDLVTNLTDLSASGFTLSNTGSGVQPYYTNNASIFNNRGYLFFDGSNDRLLHGSGEFTQPNTVFLVCYYLAGAGSFYDGTNTDTRNALMVSSTSWRFHGGANITGPANSVISDSIVFKVLYNSGAGNCYTNGVLYHSVASGLGTEPLTGLSLGTDDTGSFKANIGFAELVVYNVALSQSDIDNLTTNYFIPKWR